MNVPSGTEPVAPEPAAADTPPANWREAASRLVCARIDIIRIELADVLRRGAVKAVLLGIAVFAVVSTWLLALAGGVGALADVNGWHWYWVALAAAGLHLVVAAICVLFATRKGPEAFPITRSEFEKDRKCIDPNKTRDSNA